MYVASITGGKIKREILQHKRENIPRNHFCSLLGAKNSHVIVVYNLTIVAIGHGLLKKFWPVGTRLRSTHCREFNYLKLCRPAYFIRTT